MEILASYWHQIIFLLTVIVVAVRLDAEVKSLRKDIKEIQKRDTYVEAVKLRAEVDVNTKQISSLWDFVNKLRDKFNNGHS